jgi:hypothetical protein
MVLVFSQFSLSIVTRFSMCSFLVAFLSECLLHSNTITVSSIGSVAFIVCGLIGWTICTGWESGGHWKYWKRVLVRGMSVLSSPLKKGGTAKAAKERSWSWPLIFVRRPSTDSTLNNHDVSGTA